MENITVELSSESFTEVREATYEYFKDYKAEDLPVKKSSDSINQKRILPIGNVNFVEKTN
tara:strand:- start:2817 stop:2996 length:180 start_codon:yes stop_codon:yes gene_type:complete